MVEVKIYRRIVDGVTSESKIDWMEILHVIDCALHHTQFTNQLNMGGFLCHNRFCC